MDNNDRPVDRGVMYSCSSAVDCIPGLGKNIFPFKVFLPQRLKDDLQGLADKVDIPLSQFIREILISHFFGHTFWPEKLRTWSDDQEKIGMEWEQGLRDDKAFSYSVECPKDIDGDNVITYLNGWD